VAFLLGAICGFNAKIAAMFVFLKNLFSPKKLNAAQAWQQAGNQASSQDKLAYWLFAAPVHLVLQRDTFSLAAPAPLPLEKDESDALTAALNKYFAADNLVFFWHENTWFLRLNNNPNIQTTAPQASLNKDVAQCLATGEGAIKWASFTNEIQMLLFEHPVNIAREIKNLPVINSIWCYGGGQMEQAD
jgi:hypothetical protein